MSRTTNQPSAREEKTQAKCKDIIHKLLAEYRMRSSMTKIGDSTRSTFPLVKEILEPKVPARRKRNRLAQS